MLASDAAAYQKFNLLQMPELLPFIVDGLRNPIDLTSIKILSDYLKDNDDMRGLLLSIPLAVDLTNHSAENPFGTDRKPNNFELVPAFKGFHRNFCRRISALFAIGVLWQHYDYWFSPPFHDLSWFTHTTYGAVSYLARLNQKDDSSQKQVSHQQQFKEYLLRAWLYNSGLLTSGDRDYADAYFANSYPRRTHVLNNCNVFKFEFGAIPGRLFRRTHVTVNKQETEFFLQTLCRSQCIFLLGAPGGNVHVPIIQTLNSSAGDLMVSTKIVKTPETCNDITRYTIRNAILSFLCSPLVRDLREIEPRYFEASCIFRRIRHGGPQLFC